MGLLCVVIGRPPHVLVRQRGAGRRGLLEREPILLMLENVFDGAVAIGAEPLRAATRGFESVRAVDSAQAHQPQAGAIALLGMSPLREQAGDESPGGRATLVRPRDQAGRGPFRV